MIGYYVYHTYLKVAVGPLRQQIELNKELTRLYIAEQQTAWTTALVHVPEKEKKEIITCRKGCCKFQITVSK